MTSYNREKMTELDYKILSSMYEGEELERVLKKIDDDYPVQYAIGDVDFLGCKIKVDERVLVPRFETELLVEKTIKYIKELNLESSAVADLCTGSGCVAISLKSKLPSLNVIGVDVSDEAFELARENARFNSIDVGFLKVDVLEDFDAIPRAQVLISNPPYVKLDEPVSANTKFEPKIALYPGEDDLLFYRKILEQACRYWKELKLVAFEIGSSQGEEVCDLVKTFFPEARVSLEKDYAGLDRFIFAIVD